MTIQEIAARLVELCRKGEFETAQEELYSSDAISIEPFKTPEFEKETKGLAAIIEKGHKFQQMVEETFGVTISEPLVTANTIAFIFTMDMKMKGHERQNMAELCVYEVKDGKIAAEHFFM